MFHRHKWTILGWGKLVHGTNKGILYNGGAPVQDGAWFNLICPTCGKDKRYNSDLMLSDPEDVVKFAKAKGWNW